MASSKRKIQTLSTVSNVSEFEMTQKIIEHNLHKMGLCNCCIQYRTLNYGKYKQYCFDCWKNPNCETD